MLTQPIQYHAMCHVPSYARFPAKGVERRTKHSVVEFMVILLPEDGHSWLFRVVNPGPIGNLEITAIYSLATLIDNSPLPSPRSSVFGCQKIERPTPATGGKGWNGHFWTLERKKARVPSWV